MVDVRQRCKGQPGGQLTWLEPGMVLEEAEDWLWSSEGMGELPGLSQCPAGRCESQALWCVGASGARAGVVGGVGRGERQTYDLIQRLDSLLPLESRTMETSACREAVFCCQGSLRSFRALLVVCFSDSG